MPESLWRAPCGSVEPLLLNYRTPTKRPEQLVVWHLCDPRHGKSTTLANPQIVLGALQLVDSRCRCAIQKCITVVEPGRNNAACDCEKCGRSVDSALPKKCHLKSR